MFEQTAVQELRTRMSNLELLAGLQYAETVWKSCGQDYNAYMLRRADLTEIGVTIPTPEGMGWIREQPSAPRS